MVLDDVDLVGNLSLLQGAGEIAGLGGGEGVEIVLEVLLGGVVRGVGVEEEVVVGGEGEVGGAPVGPEEDGGRADVEEDDGVAGADVVVDGPADGVGALVGEVDGDAELSAGAGGGGGGGAGGGGVVAGGVGVVDSDLGELGIGVVLGLWVIHLFRFRVWFSERVDGRKW